ncbi:MAG: two-component regulator propeller domain-containing protein [Crocinitomicaceae bacterium]
MLKILASVFTISLITASSLGQVYNFQYINTKNGLPQSQAYAITFDDKAFAWIGTQGGGIAVYDGESIKYITQENGLLSNRVYDFYVDSAAIYCCTKGGVSVISESHVISRNIKLNNENEIAQCIVNYKGIIYVGSNKGLYKVVDSLLVPISAFNKFQINSFVSDSNNQLWVTTNEGIWKVNKSSQSLNKLKGLPTESISKAIIYKNGWLIASSGNGLWVYLDAKLARLPNTEVLNRSVIQDLLLQNNTLWIATMNDGLFQYDFKMKSLTQYTVDQGLSNNHVKRLSVDMWGNIWVGTSGGGVSIFNNSPFVTYNKSNGLISNYIYAVLNDRDQNLWVTTQGLGIQKMNDTLSVVYNEDNGFKNVKSKAIYQDLDGRIWVGTEGEGLAIIDTVGKIDTIYNIKQSNGLTSNWVRSFTENIKKRTIYIGTSNGIYECRSRKIATSDLTYGRTKGKLSNKRINDVEWNKTLNCLLFASDKGAGYIANGEVIYFDSDLSFRNIAFKDSVVWFGSVDKGVLEVKYRGKNEFESTWLTRSKGLLSHNIYQLCVDNQVLWIGTEKGISKYQLEDRVFTHFGYDEGFEGVETNINACFKDKEGQVWFGTTDGLYVYNGNEGFDSLQKQPPKLFFEDIQLFYQSINKTKYSQQYSSGKVIDLDYTDNHIGFNVQGHHFTFQNKIRYRWKLEGVDQDWSPPSKNKTATFSNLKPGTYKMLVQGSIDNQWEMDPIDFKFNILTPFWQKQWFILTYTVGSILLITFLILFFVKRQQKKNKTLIEKIELEKSVLELEQKALRLQMNPHFIFNVLNSIHQLIIVNDSSKARYALSKFSKLMRQVLENSREKLVSVDDEVELIQNYIQLEKLTSQIEFDFELNVGQEVDTNEQIVPPLMVQPFIENAIIHGFKNINHKGRIKVGFNLINDDYLLCTIEDNGSGRVAAANQKAQKAQYHKSTALQVTQERLAKLNDLGDEKDFEIIDLKDEGGNAKGTKVVIKIRLG